LPEESAAGGFAAGEADFFFQAAGPFGAGAVVGEGELFAQFVPGGAVAIPLQVLVDGGFEFGVAHGSKGLSGGSLGPGGGAEPFVHLGGEGGDHGGGFGDGALVARFDEPGVEGGAQARQGFAVFGLV